MANFRVMAIPLAVARRLAVAGSAVAATLGPAPGLVGAAGAAASPYASDVSHGRFTTAVSLFGGRVTITPAASSVRPRLSQSDAARDLWATQDIQGYTREVIGFGVVNVAISSDVMPRVHRLAAWVAVAASPALATCSSLTSRTSSKGSVPGVVLLSNDPTKPAEAIIATRATGPGSFVQCSYTPPTTELPTEVVSVPWRPVGALAHGRQAVVAQMPECQRGYTLDEAAVGSRLRVSIDAWVYLRSTAECRPGPMRLGVSWTSSSPPTGFIHTPLGPVSQTAVVGGAARG